MASALGSASNDPAARAVDAEVAAVEDDDGRDWEQITREAVALLQELSHVDWSAGKLAAELSVRGVLGGPRQGVHWKLLRKLGDRITYEGRGEHIRLAGADSPNRPAQSSADGTVSFEIVELERDVEEWLPLLRSTDMRSGRRTARLAMWAGRAREIRERATDERALARIDEVLRVLGKAGRDMSCHFIDALMPEWRPSSWTLYYRHFEAIYQGKESDLTREESQALWQSLLAALCLRPTPGRKGYELFMQAQAILGDHHPDVVATRARLFPDPSPGHGHRAPHWRSPPVSIDEIAALEREIEDGLADLGVREPDPRKRRAQIAVWAGRARDLSSRSTDERAIKRIGDLLDALANLRRALGCGFVDALMKHWEPPSWKVYCQHFEAILRDTDPNLDGREEHQLWRALVEALPQRPPAARRDRETYKQAKQILGDGHPSINAVRAELFGQEPRKDAPSRPASPSSPATTAGPRDALAVTRGRRALVISTLHESPEARGAYQTAFKFSDFRWLTANESTARHIDELARNLTPGKYHLAFFVGPLNDVAARALDACERVGAQIIPVSELGIDRMREALTEG